MSLGVTWNLWAGAHGLGRKKTPSDSCHCRDQSSGDWGEAVCKAEGNVRAAYKPTAAQVCKPFPNSLCLFMYVRETQTHFSDNLKPAELI